MLLQLLCALVYFNTCARPLKKYLALRHTARRPPHVNTPAFRSIMSACGKVRACFHLVSLQTSYLRVDRLNQPPLTATFLPIPVLGGQYFEIEGTCLFFPCFHSSSLLNPFPCFSFVVTAVAIAPAPLSILLIYASFVFACPSQRYPCFF